MKASLRALSFRMLALALILTLLPRPRRWQPPNIPRWNLDRADRMC